MIQVRAVEVAVVKGLEGWLRSWRQQVPVIRQNQTGPTPPYPYLSYTVTTSLVEAGGTYAEDEAGEFYKPAGQVWSLSAQAKEQEEAQMLAMVARDYFARAGCTELADQGIVVAKVGNVTGRDNLISYEYERRAGFDCTLSLIDRIATSGWKQSGWIETAPLKEKEQEENNGV